MESFCMDAHMHFDLYKERDDVLTYIESHHSYTIVVTNLPELYERYYHQYVDCKFIKIALGFHPELVAQYKNQFPKFLEYINTTRYIGEIGLDFTTKDKENRKTQQVIFTEIVDACKKDGGKILSVHSRRAEKECIDILNGFNGKIILHWYSGNLKTLKEAIDMGCYFSVNHQMLFSENGRRIVNLIPIERILIESDAPFSKGLGKNYSLFFADLIYDFLSKENDVSKQKISQIIKRNFRELLS